MPEREGRCPECGRFNADHAGIPAAWCPMLARVASPASWLDEGGMAFVAPTHVIHETSLDEQCPLRACPGSTGGPWRCVYTGCAALALGLEAPAPFVRCDNPQPPARPWWRFWRR